MKKSFKYLILTVTIALLFTGCKPGFSDDTFETRNIFKESHTFTYERTEDDVVNDVIYEVIVENGLVSTKIEIDFEEGMFISASTFNADTLLPISAYKSNTYDLEPDRNWEINAEYGDTLEMVAGTAAERETKSLELPAYYLDNEGLLFTIGALSLEEGFEKYINISIIDAGEIIPFRISYQGIETIESPYGTFECIKVEMKYTGLVLGSKPRMYMWYTNDENRYPIQYENSDVKLSLSNVE